MKLSIVIPVYNEERTIGAVIEKVRSLPLEKQIIIVNDASTDGTKQALAPFEGTPDVEIHHSLVNLGKGASVRIGFSKAKNEIVTIQDADLELDPTEYLRLVEPIVEGRSDVVYGSRFLGAGKRGTLSFYLANRGLAVLTNVLFGSALTDIETCYKVIRADVLRTLTLRAARFEIEPELTAQILKAGYRIVELPIKYNPRSKSDGKKLSWKDGFTAVTTLVDQRFDQRTSPRPQPRK